MTMTCPKCGGKGKIWVEYGGDSSAAPYETTCNSCGGLGYVTDNTNNQVCSKCGKDMIINWVCSDCQLKNIVK